MDDPRSVAIDANGNLFVANDSSFECGNVTVYEAATGSLENTITDGVCVPGGFAFDSLGNIYVINLGNEKGVVESVAVYSPGTNALTETITKGLSSAYALAIDPSDNLYVANAGNDTTGNPTGDVTVYPPEHTSPSATLTKGILNPFDLKWFP